jgi:hypothetical protein
LMSDSVRFARFWFLNVNTVFIIHILFDYLHIYIKLVSVHLIHEDFLVFRKAFYILFSIHSLQKHALFYLRYRDNFRGSFAKILTSLKICFPIIERLSLFE